MTMREKFSKFFCRQLQQIKAGGPRVLYNKLKRAFRLAYLSVAAPIAVYFKMDWPLAYDFLANRVFKKFKRLRLRGSGEKLQIKKLLEKGIDYLEKSTHQIPDLSGLKEWMRKSLLLGDFHEVKNDIKQSITVQQRTAEVQRQITKKYQLDGLDLEFIPRAVAQGSIGGYENLEAYIKAGMLGLHPNKKMIILLNPDVPVVNPCYLKYWSKYITIVSDLQAIEMLEPLEGRLTTPLNRFMYLQGKFWNSPMALGRVRGQWNKENRPPLLALSGQDYERGWRALRSLGLPQNAWFVALHVRESGWKDCGTSRENFRNADINTYFSAIKAITDAGGWVVRVGDPTMRKLPAMHQVVDYAHSQTKSDWMDIFLCSQCRFMIGTASGMCVVALTFGVPLVMTNLLPAHVIYYFTSNDLFIPRLCVSKETENYLSFNELIAPPLGTACTQTNFDNLNVRFVENTGEEIKELVDEMLERFNGGGQYHEEDEHLQKQFKSLTARCGQLYGNGDIVVNAMIGRNFLRKHSSLLPSSKLPNASIEV